jgi:DNA-binding MarR family transcriptional regulator
MIDDELDPVIHVPARLRIMVTLATLPAGDNLSFTRLQDLIGLTPGNLITHLRKLEDAEYVTTVKSGRGVTARTAVSLTGAGRTALDRYTAVLSELLSSVSPTPRRSRAGDADVSARSHPGGRGTRSRAR